MLDPIKILAYRLRYKRDDEIEMLLDLATQAGARVLGDKNYGFEVGKNADFVIMPGADLKELVITINPNEPMSLNGVCWSKKIGNA